MMMILATLQRRWVWVFFVTCCDNIFATAAATFAATVAAVHVFKRRGVWRSGGFRLRNSTCDGGGCRRTGKANLVDARVLGGRDCYRIGYGFSCEKRIGRDEGRGKGEMGYDYNFKSYMQPFPSLFCVFMSLALPFSA